MKTDGAPRGHASPAFPSRETLALQLGLVEYTQGQNSMTRTQANFMDPKLLSNETNKATQRYPREGIPVKSHRSIDKVRLRYRWPTPQARDHIWLRKNPDEDKKNQRIRKRNTFQMITWWVGKPTHDVGTCLGVIVRFSVNRTCRLDPVDCWELESGCDWEPGWDWDANWLPTSWDADGSNGCEERSGCDESTSAVSSWSEKQQRGQKHVCSSLRSITHLYDPAPLNYFLQCLSKHVQCKFTWALLAVIALLEAVALPRDWRISFMLLEMHTEAMRKKLHQAEYRSTVKSCQTKRHLKISTLQYCTHKSIE